MVSTALLMIKIIVINILVIITLQSFLGYVMPVISILYMYHNIRIQIIEKYDGDIKLYISSTFKPIKKIKK